MKDSHNIVHSEHHALCHIFDIQVATSMPAKSKIIILKIKILAFVSPKLYRTVFNQYSSLLIVLIWSR